MTPSKRRRKISTRVEKVRRDRRRTLPCVLDLCSVKKNYSVYVLYKISLLDHPLEVVILKTQHVIHLIILGMLSY